MSGEETLCEGCRKRKAAAREGIEQVQSETAEQLRETLNKGATNEGARIPHPVGDSQRPLENVLGVGDGERVKGTRGFETSKTERGFRLYEFTDRYGEKCSLQKSSLAFEEAIWFGIQHVQPRVMDPPGWRDIDLPEGALCSGRMHLTQDQVRDLLPALEYFAEHGELPERWDRASRDSDADRHSIEPSSAEMTDEKPKTWGLSEEERSEWEAYEVTMPQEYGETTGGTILRLDSQITELRQQLTAERERVRELEGALRGLLTVQVAVQPPSPRNENEYWETFKNAHAALGVYNEPQSEEK